MEMNLGVSHHSSFDTVYSICCLLTLSSLIDQESEASINDEVSLRLEFISKLSDALPSLLGESVEVLTAMIDHPNPVVR